MKKYISLSTDFSAVSAEILSNLQPAIDAETVTNSITSRTVVVLENASAAYASLTPALEAETFNVECIVRSRVIDKMDYPYAITHADTVVLPLANADQSIISIYEVASGVYPFNSRYPVGINPQHGSFELEDCTLINSFPIVGPILIKAGTAWSLETISKDKVAQFLLLFSTSDNSSYFAE